MIRQFKESRQDDFPDRSELTPGQRDLLIRDYNGKYYSYRLPTWEGAVLMPLTRWWQWEGGCKDFGPSTMRGKLAPESSIQCNDPGGDWFPAKDVKWSLAGKSLKPPFPDLPRLRCRHEPDGELTCR